MKRIQFTSAILGLSLFAGAAAADFVSIPASSFVGPQVSYNDTGTAAFFRTKAFAPVNLPDGATARSISCGMKSWRTKGFQIALRRNTPQQRNVDMGAVGIARGSDGGFKFLDSARLIEGRIDNRRHNYYLVASVHPKSENVAGICNGKECTIGFCRVNYTN